MGKNKGIVPWFPELIEEAVEFTQTEIMLKLISTIDDRGLPHITLISSNRAINKNEIVWGAFTEGLSKKNVKQNPKQGFLYMSAELPFKFLQVKAKFTHIEKEGEDLEYFNKSQLMRYTTYVRIHTAFYNNVTAASPVRDLSLGGIIKGIILDLIGKGGAKTKLNEKRLNIVGYDLFKAVVNVRVIAYIDPTDGYPIIIPCIQLQAADPNRLVFPFSVLKKDLLKIPVNNKVAVFGMNFDFANQLVKGTFTGIHKYRGIKFGVIEIEEIYNSSPPITGKIYPEIETRPKVTNFPKEL
jgi:hypothetical protein